MGRRQKDWANRKRAEVFADLGAQCADCGSRADLTFDCIEAHGDAHHKAEFSARTSFYLRQHRANNLQVLCRRCNTIKGTATIDFKVSSDPIWIWPDPLAG